MVSGHLAESGNAGSLDARSARQKPYHSAEMAFDGNAQPAGVTR